MNDRYDESNIGQDRRDQMLQLVSKGFYRELVNYGVKREEIIRVASHLLDNLMSQQSAKVAGGEYYDALFKLSDVEDRWQQAKELAVRGVTLRPLEAKTINQVAKWLDRPGMRELFVPPYPEDENGLHEQLVSAPDARYFAICTGGKVVGMIGGEKIDVGSR